MSQITLNQEMISNQTCRIEQRKIMSTAKEGISLIFSFNELAESLYITTMTLKPFIAVPKIKIIYDQIQQIRKKMAEVQKSVINIYSVNLNLQAISLFRKLNQDYKKTDSKDYLETNSIMVPEMKMHLAIKKSRAYLFPPYTTQKHFEDKQRLRIKMFISRKSNSFLKLFLKSKLSQVKYCSATLTVSNKNQMQILYDDKDNLF